MTKKNINSHANLSIFFLLKYSMVICKSKVNNYYVEFTPQKKYSISLFKKKKEKFPR